MNSCFKLLNFILEEDGIEKKSLLDLVVIIISRSYRCRSQTRPKWVKSGQKLKKIRRHRGLLSGELWLWMGKRQKGWQLEEEMRQGRVFLIVSTAHTHPCTHTMECYLAIKKNEILFATVWMDLEGIMLSEINQRQIPYVCTQMWDLKK